jgi:hypothetical protein
MLSLNSIHLAGVLTLIGAFFYAVADVLILAHHVGPRQEIPATAIDFEASEKWKRRASMLTTMSKLPWKRLVAGGLLGVCMTPLVMSGSWLLYQALAPAGVWFSVPVALLWLSAYPVGAFIHGSFIYYGGTIQAWNNAEGPGKEELEDLVFRMTRVLLTSYMIFFALAFATSAWFVIAVLQGTTALPLWMAIFNPFLMAAVYTYLARKVIPLSVIKYVQGAGFNIVFFIFFLMVLSFIW